MRILALPILLSAALLLAGPGCYYTKTNPDGTKEHISRKEYQQMKQSDKEQFKYKYGSSTSVPN